MPALNFKTQFVPLVVDGSKPHTIRAWRKRPFKAGDLLSFYTGSRFKPWKIRPNAICTAVRDIEIYIGMENWTVVLIEGKSLTMPQVEALAKRDGFRNAADFVAFFKETHGQRFSGQLIEWNPFTPLSPVWSSPAAAGKREPRAQSRKTLGAVPQGIK